VVQYPTVKLGDICLRITDGKHGDCENQENSGFYFLSAKDVRGGQLQYENARQITEVDFEDTHRRTQLESQDILISNSGTIGRMAIAPNAAVTRRTTFQKSVAILKTKRERVTPRWLYYALQAHLERLVGFAGGTAQKNLLLRDLRAFELDIPPLPTQKKIASILSAYDDLIENNERRIRILEEMAQNLYREWFVKFRFPGHGKVKMVDSPLGKIPEGWEWRPVEDFLEKSIGGGWGKDEQSKAHTNPVRVIRGTDFRRIAGGSFEGVPSRFVKDSELRSRKLQHGDVIVENSVNASSRCVGTPFIVSEGILRQLGSDSICASFCKMYRPKRAELAVLLCLHIRNLRGEGKMSFYQNVAANGIGNFQSKRFLSDECIPVPRDDDRLSAMLGVISDLTTSTYCERIATLRQTRDLLLPKLISGQLDVSELDIEVPEVAV